MRFSAKQPPFKVISGFSLLLHWHWLGSSYFQPQRFHTRQKKMRMAGLIRLFTSKPLALCRLEKYPHARAGAPVKVMSAVSLSPSTDMRPSRNQWSLVTSLLQFSLNWKLLFCLEQVLPSERKDTVKRIIIKGEAASYRARTTELNSLGLATVSSGKQVSPETLDNEDIVLQLQRAGSLNTYW